MLPRAELKPLYDELVWLYVFRDFSGSEADLAAERTCIRMGFTSYPQMWLLDPVSLKRLKRTGRTLEPFVAAANSVKVPAGEDVSAVAAMREAEGRAAKLRKSGSVKQAKAAIDESDLVLRYRALQVLAEKAPKEVVARAESLLATPNDPVRFEVCKVLGKAGHADAAPALAAIAARPKDTLNPNVLRISAVRALGGCGDATSIAAVAPFATTGDTRNGLTGVSIDALVAIAARHPDAREPSAAALRKAWPATKYAPEEARRVMGLARRVHGALAKVTGKKPKLPKNWNEAALEEMRKAFGK